MELKRLADELLTDEEREKIRNCPYSCVDGQVFVPALGSFSDCPNCSDIYKKMVEGNTKHKNNETVLNKLLIPDKYKNKTFNLDEFFPESVVTTTSSESRSEILESMDLIIKKSLLGEEIEDDYLFYLGMETDKFPFVLTVLKNYLKAGVKIAPYLDTGDLAVFYKHQHDYFKDNRECLFLSESLNTSYEELCSDDICIVLVPICALEFGIQVLQDFVRKRRGRNKRTIVISETLDHSRQMGYVLNQFGFKNRFLESKKKKSVAKVKTSNSKSNVENTKEEPKIEDLSNPSSTIFDKL